MELKRILVAVNSPNGRDAAFDRALAIGQASGAELYLLHAVPLNQSFSRGAGERLKRMADMRQRAEDVGLRVRTVEQHGDPAGVIDLHATARAVDLVVIGAEASRGWMRRSRIAEEVIRRTNVPTLVVASDAADTTTPFRNVLVAVDLSPASEDALRRAVALTADEAVQLTVMHTVKGLEAAAATRTISAHAADIDADLVVVGRSRGFTMLGSTALRLLRKNERALLVIPSDSRRTSRVERQLAA